MPEPNAPGTAPSALETASLQALQAGGAFASEPHFRVRESQLRMVSAVCRAIDRAGLLAVEAGTGVGKTYAYLVPVLLSGKKTLIATATKNLQEQLFWRDLPRATDTLRIAARTALLKGRSSYLCRERLPMARQMLTGATERRWLASIERWAQETRTGDLADWSASDPAARAELSAASLGAVTSTPENCLGSKCPEFAACHVNLARRQAMEADIVVVNHHLFFADLSLRETGMAELLPSVEILVFDEAHELGAAGIEFLGVALSLALWLQWARDWQIQGQRKAPKARDWVTEATRLEGALRAWRLSLGAVPVPRRLEWTPERARRSRDSLEDLLKLSAALLKGMGAELRGSAPELQRLYERLTALQQAASVFLEPLPRPGHVRWLDLGVHSAKLVEAPLDIREALLPAFARGGRAWIFTSATLGHDEELTWFARQAGLTAQPNLETLRLPSPFDYATQSRLFIPADWQEPQPESAAEHTERVAQLAAQIAQRLGGRLLLLTTTLGALPRLQQRLRALLPPGMAILMQGGALSRSELLQRFRDAGAAVLLGAYSFWQGVDIPGEALQAVLIDKLPFPPPDDPFVRAHADRIRAAGEDPFWDYAVPEAIIALKQGAGRLIRSETDRGLLVIADPRLARRGYRHRLLAALPPMTPLNTQDAALDFLTQLAAAPLSPPLAPSPPVRPEPVEG